MSGQLSARLARIRASAAATSPDTAATKPGFATDTVGKVQAAEYETIRMGLGDSPALPDAQASALPPLPSLSSPAFLGPNLEVAGWQLLAPYVAFRKLAIAPPPILPAFFSCRLSILSPGSSRVFLPDRDVDARRLLFFDLETSGLSGGAGTVAFLAAFGRFIPRDDGNMIDGQGARFEIVQYLLCDYPGEATFLECINAEFQKQDPVLASYNGKAFDMQIIRTRFSMNRLDVPELPHWDLLHAVRRLWRRTLPSCSQQSVERHILGIYREDDLPGSQAPDAWFDYLRNRSDSLLAAVGEHNAQDIAGIAHLSVALDRIARAPLAASQVSAGALAHAWWLHTKRTAHDDGTTDALLEKAFSEGDPRASLILASRLYKRGFHERAAEIRRALVLGNPACNLPQAFQIPSAIRLQACRQLATDAERRLKSFTEALGWMDLALAVENVKERMCVRLATRRERLLQKVERERLKTLPGIPGGEYQG